MTGKDRLDYCPAGFSGKEFSNGSGLELYETPFRLYDPQLGRFFQVDPLADATKSFTPFSFGSDNPILRIDPNGLKDTVINGQIVQRDKDLAPASVTAVKHKHLPNNSNSQDPSLPYSDITSVALDRNMDQLEKIQHLRSITSATVPYVSRHLDGLFLKKALSTSLLHMLDKMFTVIDIYSLGKFGVDGNQSQILIPILGDATQLIVDDAVASSDEVVLSTAASQGYVPLARVLNSSVGRRSGLVGVYVSEQTLQAILANGGIDPRIKGIVDPGGVYPDNPQNSGNAVQFFVVFPKKQEGTITIFGVMPIH